MVNNIELIKPFLKFESDDDFYILEIIKRKKENPNLGKNNTEVAQYYITSVKELEKVMPDVIAICDATNSRAYINLNSRSFQMIALFLNKKMGDILLTKDYRFARRAFLSEAHSHTNEQDKTYIVDFDYTDGSCSMDDSARFDLVKELLFKLQKQTGVQPLLYTIPTKNGVHIITRPFNIKKFKDTFPLIDIHKDGITLCYIS